MGLFTGNISSRELIANRNLNYIVFFVHFFKLLPLQLSGISFVETQLLTVPDFKKKLKEKLKSKKTSTF